MQSSERLINLQLTKKQIQLLKEVAEGTLQNYNNEKVKELFKCNMEAWNHNTKILTETIESLNIVLKTEEELQKTLKNMSNQLTNQLMENKR